MVWGMIGPECGIALIPVHGRMNSDAYIESILKPLVLSNK